MRLRQIALVASNLDQVHDDVAAVLGLDHAFRDAAVAKYGLRNVVFAVGDTFLEIVSPEAPGTTAGRLLAKRGGDSGYMVILQVPDVTAARQRVRDLDIRIVEQLDRDGAALTHLHPKDTGGALLSLDWMDAASRWDWGGPRWQHHVRTDISVSIVAAEVHASDSAKVASTWASVLQLPITRQADHFSIKLRSGELRFVEGAPDQGDGLAAFDVLVRDATAVQRVAASRGLVDGQGAIRIAGTVVRLIEA